MIIITYRNIYYIFHSHSHTILRCAEIRANNGGTYTNIIQGVPLNSVTLSNFHIYAKKLFQRKL